MTERPGWHHEVRIDNIVALSLERHAAQGSHGQIRQHGGKVCYSQLSAEEYRHTQSPYAILDALGRQIQRSGCEHRYIVPPRKFLCQGAHRNAATATQRWVFIIAEENLHAVVPPLCRAVSCTNRVHSKRVINGPWSMNAAQQQALYLFLFLVNVTQALIWKPAITTRENIIQGL